MDTTYLISYPNDRRTVSFTIGEIIDSIEQNGLPQIMGDFWSFSESDYHSAYVRRSNVSRVLGACAMGMSAINLRIDYDDLSRGLRDIFVPNHFMTQDQADQYDAHTDSCWDGEGLTCGDNTHLMHLETAIVEMNDNDGLTFKEIADFLRNHFKNNLNDEVTFEADVINVSREVPVEAPAS